MDAWSRPPAGVMGCLLDAGVRRAQGHPTSAFPFWKPIAVYLLCLPGLKRVRAEGGKSSVCSLKLGEEPCSCPGAEVG